ncbi:MAG TPA: sugar phosphate nucleotidyltransferase [Gemmatimonadales bacterium]|nr:sugar phosphate nucleotidyltransferase [Gemmatimonadales bacterium]
MQVIIPLAGKGTRLLPLTRRVPKPLIEIAGRPMMDYVMDLITGAGLEVDELLVITGHLKDEVERYISAAYSVPARFLEQRTLDGTAGAVNLARPYVHGPVLIVFVDTLFDADLSLAGRLDADGIIWAKEVEDYQRFGVVVHDADGFMTRIIEKPKTPVSKLANIGLYYIRDWRTLFDGIAHVLAGPPNGAEFYLTDAFQYMVDHGKKLFTAPVAGWYDCGKVDTLLATNRHLLEQGRARRPAPRAGVTIHDPVFVADGVTLADCSIGPNVSIGTGSSIRGGAVRDSIVGHRARLDGATVEGSLIGDDQVIERRVVRASVVDGGEEAPAR